MCIDSGPARMPVDAIHEAASNYKSTIGRTISETDVQKVWQSLGEWIEKHLINHKGVVVPGLGTFTLSEWSLDTGLGRPLVVSRPAFVLAESLVRAFAVRQRQVYISGRVACHVVHYGGVAALAGLDHATAKSCVKEVAQALKRLLWQCDDVTLDLGRVGRLTISRKEVQVEFTSQLEDRVRGLAEKRRTTVRPVYPWSPQKILA